jgi:hydrogenase maturation protein HypF
LRVRATGVVQGVGFRPFVYGLATRLDLVGWVRNTASGVEIEVDGDADALRAFVEALRAEAPPLARIDRLESHPQAPAGSTSFVILESHDQPGAFLPISADVGLCADCLRELFDPGDRRYRYPFINCTNCGPRFTIITAIPYDRSNTTMAGFRMCPACAAEYQDPRDRRFHAQPIACPACGPRVWLERGGVELGRGDTALAEARQALRAGGIVAVKGLGGFHLACDAGNAEAVSELRRRKLRVDKAFAVMTADVPAAEAHGVLEEGELELLQSPARPIVVVPRRPGSWIAREVAPGQDTLGVMLPYTPLHHLLLERATGFPDALVMTSGNLSEEPIATDNGEARARLGGLADVFLMHDRPIHTRCDDSVVRRFDDHAYPLRRARGYAPYPVHLPWAPVSILAGGAELKNAFCLTRGDYAFVSQAIGDLQNYETLRSFEDGIEHFERLFRVRVEALAYDLHPDYLASRYVRERAAREGIPAFGVQHHHAHIAACMAEHGLPGDRPVIGVAFDGTGYGDDASVWGGEFLLADYAGYRRLGHLQPIEMPGGEACVRQPWRLALAWLRRAGIEWDDDLPPVEFAEPAARGVVSNLLARSHAGGSARLPMTSSMGRLFDAVAALIGVRQSVNYEAQAAIELEALVDPAETGEYSFGRQGAVLDPRPVIQALVTDRRAGVSAPRLAARFHRGVAGMVAGMCEDLRNETGETTVALSGGVWQNLTLLTDTVGRLRRDGFRVLTHCQVPANDGGIALGQAVVAAAAWGAVSHRMKDGGPRAAA